MRLKPFKKEKEISKEIIKKNAPLLLVPLVIGVIGISYLVSSFAFYNYEVKDVQIANAKVGDFSGDITLAIVLDGEKVDRPPEKGVYDVTVNCDNATGRWDDEEWGAVIGNITSSRVTCNINFLTPINSYVEIGDYISMTPTSTSYTPPSNLTGCLNDSNCTQNTIDPSELNLWRVINKNANGTIDVVSEYASSTNVYFYGYTGISNFVGGLNEIAAQYTNEKYVLNTRHMGYSNQKLCDTRHACTDEGYEKDINLVETATGSLIKKTPSGEDASYWIASRKGASSESATYFSLSGRYVSISGNLSSTTTQTLYTYYSASVGRKSVRGQYKVVPILTLKAGIRIDGGDGTSESPYTLK